MVPPEPLYPQAEEPQATSSVLLGRSFPVLSPSVAHTSECFLKDLAGRGFLTDSPTPTQHPQISPLYMQVSNSRAVLTTALQDVSALTSQEWQLCSGSELWSGLSGQGQRDLH